MSWPAIPPDNRTQNSTGHLADHAEISDFLTYVKNSAFSSGVTSFNSRAGIVAPGNADYLAVASGGLTGATAPTRFVGGTTTGHPTSGTFAVGDFSVAQDAQIWICTTAGSPGTWTLHTGLPVFPASAFGIKADGGITDNGPLLNAAFKTLWNSGNGQGGIIVLPQCGFMAGGNTAVTTSQTIVIPPYCGLVGMGKQKTMLRLMSGSNCDLIQFMVYGGGGSPPAIATSQAALLGVSVGTLQNCFYGRIQGMTLHGSWNFQSATDYHSCIHAETVPATTAASGDPDFDPTNLIVDVEMRYASGDGFLAIGRSGTQLADCLIRYCQGNGASPSFDTLFSNVEVGFNGIAGIYMNHGSTSGDGKLYNNGNIAAWISGTAYSVGNRVMSAGVCYGCIVATSGTTAPVSDATHWTAIATTSPAAFGYDLYLDSNCYENRWAVDSQEPTAGSIYLKGAQGCTITGVSNRPNFDNPTTGVQLATNPNSLAVVTLDGAVGCSVNLSYTVLNTACYAIKVINSSRKNNVLLSGDATWQAMQAPGSSLTGNFVVIDGATQSGGGGSGMVQQAATSATGYTLINGTGTILSWTAPADGNLHTVMIATSLIVTSGETGGQIAAFGDLADGTNQGKQLYAAGLGAGYYWHSDTNGPALWVLKSGGTISLTQNNALTAGAAKLYATIFGA